MMSTIRIAAIPIILLFVFTLSSGTNRVQSVFVNIKKHFSIEVMDYLSPQDGINDEALLQYAYSDYEHGERKEIYLLIFHQTYKSIKANMLGMNYSCKSYLNLCADNVEYSLNISERVDLQEKPIQIDGMNFMSCEIEGDWKDMEMYYQVGVVEGPKAFYELIAWTPLEYKDDYKEDISEMFSTFKKYKK